VASGDAVFSPHLAGFVLDAFAGGPAEAGPITSEVDQLTPREQQVMQHLARGYAYKEIAHELGISLKTVESHASAVLRKLQLSSRHHLTRWAAQHKLL
jgi:DNA-binding NarL/FixJ family response regulator